MAFLIGGANSAADDAYSIDNSCRFNAGDSAYMTRTFGSAGNRRTWTFSTWCKRAKFGAQQTLFGSSADGSNYHLFYWGSDETLTHNFSGTTTSAASGAEFRDPSAWYHVVCAVDTTQGTAANRVKLYVNGASVGSGSYPSENAEMILNNNVRCDVGSSGAHFTSHMLGGYLAETVFIDGTQYDASDFGEFDSDSPTIWKPKDVSGLTFGTNGFWFDYKASGTLGNDANGGTDWTATNLAATDQTTDTPTNNFAVANPLQAHADTTFDEGNTRTRQLSSANALIYGISTIGVAKGKWYMEFKHVTNDNDSLYGITTDPSADHQANNYPGQQAHSFGFLTSDGNSVTGGSGSSYGSAAASNNIIGVALDITNENLYFAVNNTWQDSGDPTSGATGTGAIDISGIGAGQGFYFFAAGSDDTSNYDNPSWNFGNPAYSLSSAANDGNGYGNFEYAPPSGFLSLCTKNLGSDGQELIMAYTTIDDPEAYFQAKTYSGTGSSLAVTLDGDTDMSPNMVWIKSRSHSNYHVVTDTVRGVTEQIYPNDDGVEETTAGSLTVFGSDGFTVAGSSTDTNGSGRTYVAWCWKESATAGFDIVSWTGDGTSQDISHNLSAVPTTIIVKNRSAEVEWYVYNVNNGNTHSLVLNSNAAKAGAYSDNWNNTTPTSSVFTVGSSQSTGGSSGNNMIAYVFTDIQGFSKVNGFYTGNGNADGPFLYTGFRPSLVIWKKTSATGAWPMYDIKRDTVNPMTKRIQANDGDTEADQSAAEIDFLSNGIKLRTTDSEWNGSGVSYVFMAFAEQPFVNSNGVPCNAR